ncbi:MAG: hypothetical protein QOG83_1547 [Alphaproteobacteria bacterium]|jgi:hypothetical protein|nr:hypothetical protein [Alphaproteobacteria bacterium]
MRHRCEFGLVALAALLMTAAAAHAFDDAKYPDWKGQWIRLPPTGGQWDPNRPSRDQQAPLTAEYKAIFEAGVADSLAGGHGNNATPTCRPPGMPRAMIVYEPMEIVILPETTYLHIEFMSQFRRIFSDGRNFPQTITPSFSGYSIGHWEDSDGDGRYDTLIVETRGLKGPRTFDGNMPLHNDNQTVVKERIFLDKAHNDILRNEVTTIDHALTRPWTVIRSYSRERKPVWHEYPCGEYNQHVFIGKENYLVSADRHLMPARKDQAPPDLRYFGEPPK